VNFKIHRGTHEIGGSCVEIWTDTTRIVVDIGMPLVGKDGKDFNFKKYETFSSSELVKKGVLPDISCFYENSKVLIDGVLISHAHQDHYGFSRYLNKNIHYYLGEATLKIIELSCDFTPQISYIKRFTHFKHDVPFSIGDIRITPFLTDHSAFDAYSFLIESGGKSVFYSGDFRGHGRKAKMFDWFLEHAPQNVDYLLLEGTQISRGVNVSKTEPEIKDELREIFSEPGKINLIYTSGQNIDRLVSLYKACGKLKIFVVDVYVATVLKSLSKFAAIPYPSKKWQNVKVLHSSYRNKKLKEEGRSETFLQFGRTLKITRQEINENPGKIVMIVRPSMQVDLAKIDNLKNGNLIYSLWKGYLEKQDTKKFVDWLESRGFEFHYIHTSGHADLKTLNQLVNAIKPKNIIPIHTDAPEQYKNHFCYPVREIDDGEVISL